MEHYQRRENADGSVSYIRPDHVKAENEPTINMQRRAYRNMERILADGEVAPGDLYAQLQKEYHPI